MLFEIALIKIAESDLLLDPVLPEKDLQCHAIKILRGILGAFGDKKNDRR